MGIKYAAGDHGEARLVEVADGRIDDGNPWCCQRPGQTRGDAQTSSASPDNYNVRFGIADRLIPFVDFVRHPPAASEGGALKEAAPGKCEAFLLIGHSWLAAGRPGFGLNCVYII